MKGDFYGDGNRFEGLGDETMTIETYDPVGIGNVSKTIERMNVNNIKIKYCSKCKHQETKKNTFCDVFRFEPYYDFYTKKCLRFEHR